VFFLKGESIFWSGRLAISKVELKNFDFFLVSLFFGLVEYIFGSEMFFQKFRHRNFFSV